MDTYIVTYQDAEGYHTTLIKSNLCFYVFRYEIITYGFPVTDSCWIMPGAIIKVEQVV